MRYDDVLRDRRSIRRHLPCPVAQALIEEMLSLTMLAHSLINTHPWNFTLVTGEPIEKSGVRVAAEQKIYFRASAPN